MAEATEQNRPSEKTCEEAFTRSSTNDTKETQRNSDTSSSPAVDIEHVPVANDPRAWSPARKWTALMTIASGAFITGLSTSIYNPGVGDIKRDIGASSNDISLSLSLYVIIAGLFPMIWSATSEMYGRKPVYLASLVIAMVGCIFAAMAQTPGVLIGMRCIQSVGSSSMLAVGAGTISDIYDSHERGSKMGIYYAAPMLGPSLGPVLGGILTQYLGWRSTFWFLVIWTGVTALGFVWPYKETFRKERSTTYQKAVARRERKSSTVPHSSDDREGRLHGARPSFRDLNPFPPMAKVIRRWTNLNILITSGIVFGYSYSLQYTVSLTLEQHYDRSALDVGLILLAYGCGSILGSVFGGKYSDICWRRRKSKLEEGEDPPAEVRLEIPMWSLPWLPGLALAYGWMAQERIHLAGIVIVLFFNGLAVMWTFSAFTTYLVDATTGNAAIAAAANSLFRGFMAFAAAELCVPIRDRIGEGGLYSIWAGIWCIGTVLVVLVFLRGTQARSVYRIDGRLSPDIGQRDS